MTQVDASLSEQQMYLILPQICSIMQQLQQARLVHRDIKGPNMYMSKTGLLQLLDFGLCCEEGTPFDVITGTFTHLSPELLATHSNTGVYAASSDW